MRDRLITLAGGLISLLLVVSLMIPGGQSEPDVSRPTSVDRGEHGLYALHEWLSRSGLPVASLRQRYTELDAVAPGAGNLLILSLPRTQAPTWEESMALREWIVRGNHVLALTVMRDYPEWMLAAEASDLDDQLTQWTLATTGSELSSKGPVTLVPVAPLPVLNEVRVVSAQVAPDRAAVKLGTIAAPLVAVALLRDGDHPAMWRVGFGEGGLWISAHSDLFSNQRLGNADNARLLANLANRVLGEHGKVVFDDYHFGLSDLYDPAAFFKDARLWASLGFIGVFWLLYLIGYTNRLAPVPPRREAVHGRTFVEAVGGLFARRLSDADVGDGLPRHFFNEVRRRHGLPANGEPAWEWLERHPAIDRDALARLRRLAANRNRKLIELSQTIHRLRKTLS